MNEARSTALASLNAVERDFLSLLGEGHTAKTIATLRGVSEAAVNERFRSARRKTGVASSRQLARLLVTQENRDEILELAEPPYAPSASSRTAGPASGRAFSRWSVAMIVTALAALALIAPLGLDTLNLQTGSPAPTRAAEAPENPFVTAARQEPDITALSAEARSGGTDAEWRHEAEVGLAAAYRNEPGMSALRNLNVVCSDALCEVLGETAGGVSVEGVTNMISHAESPAIADAVKNLKLTREYSGVRTNNGEPFKGWIVSYWRRGVS